jgi:AraC family transcriptional regulator of adaptative response / DNA-3-methyladenine glycosylase II
MGVRIIATMVSNKPFTASQDDACYLALKARDARFDGRFFTGVTSTGIYCRPVCRVRTPRRENCCFFTLAAQAEASGFRPCLRCRPELAPGHGSTAALATGLMPVWSTQDASAILARQAAQLLDTTPDWSTTPPTMEAVAQRLGISARHLRRIFEACWGVSPLQYWQTRRLLSAKQLLTDTNLPIAQIASLSGFASVRRFNAAFVESYRLQPGALRKAQPGTNAPSDGTGILLKVTYRPPYDVASMLAFFSKRHIPGVESVHIDQGTMARTLSLALGARQVSGWVQARFLPKPGTVELHIAESLAQALPQVLARLRAMLDLDADPDAIQAVLERDFPATVGLRVPGTLDGFEVGVRAILGQQVTVGAARTLSSRLVERFGTSLQTPFADVNRLFPLPHVLAQANSEDLGQLGIVRQRQRAIQALAQAVSVGALRLHPGVDIPATLAALQALPGIGPWTAHYIAMRALRWPDAFPAGDVALQKALGVRDAHNPAQAAEAASLRWQPWRSYAVVRAWNSLLL